jgi:serine/threonine protein kinase
MSPEQWRQVDQFFHEASALPPSERTRFLELRCPDAKVRAEVESLLASDRKTLGFIDQPPEIPEQVLCEFDPASPPRQFGPYELREKIGEGGMGAVYTAQRVDGEFHRTVAIKLVGAQLEGEFALRRFRLERQILADLSHPNITMLLDGGTTPEGRPYLVMEYIEGTPLPDYCASANLSLEQRIELFRLVCLAVDYAHRRQVIHRDLKPSNILVTAEGVPKLLDFGIAKIFGTPQESSAGNPLTVRMLMTPEYASPEQLRGEEPSFASDIYSLGVILHELIRGASTEPRPSPKLPSKKNGKPSLVLGRPHTLEAIVVKSLSRNPEERYQTAAELASVLQQFTGRGEVERPSSLRRRRLAAGAVVALAGTGIHLWLRTNRQKRLSTGDPASGIPEANEYFERALLLSNTNWDPRRIIELLEKALALDPEFSAARGALGFFELMMFDGGLSADPASIDRAELHLLRALKEDSSSAQTHRALAALYYYRRRPDLVDKHAAEALRRNPANAMPKNWVLNVRLIAGELDAARRLAVDALKLNPLLSGMRMNLAEILREQGDPAAAIRKHEKNLEINPKRIQSLIGGAQAMLDLGQSATARQFLERGPEEQRQNYQYRLAQALLLAHEGDCAGALEKMDDNSRQWAAHVPFATGWVAEIYAVLGEHALALDWLEKAAANGDRRATWYEMDPHLATLRREPRFLALMQSMRKGK